MNKKKIILTGILSATFSIGLGFTLAPNAICGVAEAHFMSSAEEHSIGQSAVQKVEAEYETSFDDDLAYIQRRIVESNPEYLNVNDGVHKRWLSPMKMYHSDSPNAFMLPGGYGYMADSMVNFMNTYQNDGYINNNRTRYLNGANIYNTSAVAFVMGHEFGHWAGKDHLEGYDKQFGLNFLVGIFGGQAGSIGGAMAQSFGVNLVDTLIDRQMSFNQEKGADEWGLKFLENVPEYSTGGALMKFDRFLRLEEIRYPDGKRPKNFRNPHPETQKRFDRTMDYIRKSSNNRVDVIGSELYVDGTKIPVYGREDIVQRERVFYIAGQIAAAIKHDMFHERNVHFVPVPDSPVASDRNKENEGYLFVVNDAQTETKIIDKFRYDQRKSFEENMSTTMYANGDMETFGSIINAMNAYDSKKK